ncbi:hypothetical protein KIN20_014088 [Parelaphostrongylus tenuis]|uniref:Uncharacterized protein n=1 Tax=Parelaphostrongylus tenuis TaxID=148309 RepID=A0AAD5QN40_PARTN|nr:hypothetical protein KIN20_014088 [Parelaphostrongylus tenuis]
MVKSTAEQSLEQEVMPLELRGTCTRVILKPRKQESEFKATHEQRNCENCD